MAQARKAHGARIRVLRSEFAESDRAQTEKATHDFIKVLVSRRGRVLGATIVRRRAGELALPRVLAISRRSRIGALAGAIAPYLTLGELNKRVAGIFYALMLFSRRTRALVRFLGLFG